VRRLLALSVLTLAAVGLTAPAANGGSAFVSATPGTGPPGTPIAIEGNCGVATADVNVFIGFEINSNSVTIATATTDSSGAFTANATAPQIAPPIIVPGAGEIVALCQLSDAVRVTAPFTLLDSGLGAPPVPPAPPAADPSAAAEPAPPAAVAVAAPTFTG
jgi:hypothetical protein